VRGVEGFAFLAPVRAVVFPRLFRDALVRAGLVRALALAVRDAVLGAGRALVERRFAERVVGLDAPLGFRPADRLPPLRLAMLEVLSFQNLDSFAISVVRSVAYRKSASPRAQALTLAYRSC
jgi:hypothetical protein